MNNVTVQSSLSGSRSASCVIEPDEGLALGLGLTNECNLACALCYRDQTRADRLSLDQVKAVMERLPVRSVNLGTLVRTACNPTSRPYWPTCGRNRSSSPSLPNNHFPRESLTETMNQTRDSLATPSSP
jgi:hypothetical protein